MLTAEGRLLHERTHEAGGETRAGQRTVRALPLVSEALGVVGVADVVELVREGRRWRPFPVEYKRGRPKAHRADEVQLCAQALCLEEMLAVEVPAGALFYGRTRRRVEVAFDDVLRALTRKVAAETRAMIEAGRTPAPVYEKQKCDACSLIELCRPKRLGRVGPVAAWLRRRIEEEA